MLTISYDISKWSHFSFQSTTLIIREFVKISFKKIYIYLTEGMDNFFFIIQDKDYIDVKYVVKEMYFLTNFKTNSREGCPTSMKTKPREKMAFYFFKF